jgi:hypothetical protein
MSDDAPFCWRCPDSRQTLAIVVRKILPAVLLATLTGSCFGEAYRRAPQFLTKISTLLSDFSFGKTSGKNSANFFCILHALASRLHLGLP